MGGQGGNVTEWAPSRDVAPKGDSAQSHLPGCAGLQRVLQHQCDGWVEDQGEVVGRTYRGKVVG